MDESPEKRPCASCGGLIDPRHPHSGHTPECRQPEQRMRRCEGAINELSAGFRAMAIALFGGPDDCLAPNGCGGADLCCNCADGGRFAGDCGIPPGLVKLLDERAARIRESQRIRGELDS